MKNNESTKLIKLIARASFGATNDKHSKDEFVLYKLKNIFSNVHEDESKFNKDEFLDRLISNGYEENCKRYYCLFLNFHNITFNIICQLAYAQFTYLYNGKRSDHIIANISGKELADKLYEVDNLIPKWLDEEYPALKIEADKINKNKAVTDMSVDTLLKKKLKELNLQFYAEHLNIKSNVWINLGKKQIKISIPHKNLVQNIDNICETLNFFKSHPEVLEYCNSDKYFWSQLK